MAKVVTTSDYVCSLVVLEFTKPQQHTHRMLVIDVDEAGMFACFLHVVVPGCIFSSRVSCIFRCMFLVCFLHVTNTDSQYV